MAGGRRARNTLPLFELSKFFKSQVVSPPDSISENCCLHMRSPENPVALSKNSRPQRTNVNRRARCLLLLELPLLLLLLLRLLLLLLLRRPLLLRLLRRPLLLLLLLLLILLVLLVGTLSIIDDSFFYT